MHPRRSARCSLDGRDPFRRAIQDHHRSKVPRSKVPRMERFIAGVAHFSVWWCRVGSRRSFPSIRTDKLQMPREVHRGYMDIAPWIAIAWGRTWPIPTTRDRCPRRS